LLPDLRQPFVLRAERRDECCFSGSCGVFSGQNSGQLNVAQLLSTTFFFRARSIRRGEIQLPDLPLNQPAFSAEALPLGLDLPEFYADRMHSPFNEFCSMLEEIPG
jgi:hypothetical protein